VYRKALEGGPQTYSTRGTPEQRVSGWEGTYPSINHHIVEGTTKPKKANRRAVKNKEEGGILNGEKNVMQTGRDRGMM